MYPLFAFNQPLYLHLVGFQFCKILMTPLFFMENDLDKALNMTLIHYFFEQLSGLKINFCKSKIFCFVQAKEMEESYKEHFWGVNLSHFLLNILGFQFTLGN
jgi:hypothetical protein